MNQLALHNDVQIIKGGQLSIQGPARQKWIPREQTAKTVEQKFGIPTSQ